MRNKFVALIMGLMVILIVPAVTGSCLEHAKKDKTEQASEPEVTRQAFAVNDLGAGLQVQYAGLFVLTQDDSGTDTQIVGESPGEVVPAPDVFSWENILIVILGVISALFGTLWKRARDMIKEIDKALADGNVSKAELKSIVKAWKGK
jgi:hypothetical protein